MRYVDIHQQKWSHTGAIFCGGKSFRMGQAKAGMMMEDGRTLIECVYEMLSNLCEKVVLVGHAEGIPESMKHITVIEDNHVDCGPLGGLEALLSSNLDSEYIVVPCDTPFLTADVLKLLWLHPNISCALRAEDQLQPLMACYSTALLPIVRECLQQQNMSMHHFIKHAKVEVVDVPSEYVKLMQNINYPEDVKS